MANDIAGRQDIEKLVDAFYDKVKKDETIGFIFHKIIGNDWSHHLPIMYQFWETVIFNVPGYAGNPIKKHIEVDKTIPLAQEHYERWIQLWHETIDSMFAGPRADDMKKRAVLMMQLISSKIDWARKGNFIQ